ncbi:MAG: GyrI-like domain-containing protein [Actinotalea sp.]|nr:GyrI-like domain-containing protein [Actinotalea sp.]
MDVERVDLGPALLIGLHEVVPMPRLTEFFSRAFPAAAAGTARLGLEVGGPAVALYAGPVDEHVDVTAGFLAPDPRWQGAPDDGLTATRLPEGRAVVTTHVGPYDTMEATYGELSRWLSDAGLRPRDVMWEEYLDGPDTEPDPSRWRTRIVQPVV